MADATTYGIESLPTFLQIKDLVELGLYQSEDAVYLAKRRGQVPNFVQFGRKTIFPRDSVIQFIQKNSKNGSIPHPYMSSGEEETADVKS